MIKLRHLFEQQQDDIHTIVVGGIAPATAEWMKEQWEPLQLLKGVTFINHDDKSKFNELLQNNNITHIMGFSAGAKLIWPHINNSNFEVIGLIDPSTKKIYESLPTNVRMISRWNNWGGYPSIRNKLKAMEESGVSKRVEKKHLEMPNRFFSQNLYL